MSPSFSQRYGYEPLPKPMRLEELSSDLRVEVWNEVRQFLLGKRDAARFHYRSSSFYGTGQEIY